MKLCMVMIVFGGIILAGAEKMKMPVLVQSNDIVNYMYGTDIPRMTEYSICMWLRVPYGTQSNVCLFSMASAAQSNDATVFWQARNDLNQYYLQYHSYKDVFRLNITPQDYAKIRSKWTKLCFVFKRSDKVKLYADLNVPNEMVLISEANTTTRCIDGGDTLVLFSDQDAQLSEFSLSQIFLGKMAWFNIWNYALTVDEITGLGCKDRGNAFTTEELQEQGKTNWIEEQIPCNDYNNEALPKKSGKQKQTALYCKVPDYKLENHVLTTIQSTQIDCVKACTKNADCASANFDLLEELCTLNTQTDLNTTADNFVPADYHVHFTTRDC